MIAVTKIIDLLDKPALVYWANKIGLSGININDYYLQTQNEGNISHSEIENYFKHGTRFDGCDILENSLKGFEVIGIEEPINNGFLVGRIDIILKKGNTIFVGDFKRNKRVYLKTKLQLSTYKHMLGADKIFFINTENYQLEEIKIDTSKYYEIVKRLYQINELLNELKEKL